MKPWKIKNTQAKPKGKTMAKQNINNKKKKYNRKENETKILNQPWKYSYEEWKFSCDGPWTLPNLSMFSGQIWCEFVHNSKLGMNTHN